MEIASDVLFRVSLTPMGKPKARNDIPIHEICLKNVDQLLCINFHLLHSHKRYENHTKQTEFWLQFSEEC